MVNMLINAAFDAQFFKARFKCCFCRVQYVLHISTGLTASYIKSTRLLHAVYKPSRAITFPAQAESPAINHTMTRCTTTSIMFTAHTHKKYVYSNMLFSCFLKDKPNLFTISKNVALQDRITKTELPA